MQVSPRNFCRRLEMVQNGNMDPIELQKRYSLLRVSDVIRDGMWLEMYESGATRELVMTAFYSDIDGRLVLHIEQQEVPFDIVEAFMQKARHLLPPTKFE